MKEKIVLIGSGQHARVVLYNLQEQNKYDVACIIDGNEGKKEKNLKDILLKADMTMPKE